MITRIIEFVERYSEGLFLVVAGLLIGLTSFAIGRITAQETVSGDLRVESTPVHIETLIATNNESDEEQGSTPADERDLRVVGNRQSKIFHYSDCPGAQRMLETNKVYFASIEAAVSAGYRPAGNCPGL